MYVQALDHYFIVLNIDFFFTMCYMSYYCMHQCFNIPYTNVYNAHLNIYKAFASLYKTPFKKHVITPITSYNVYLLYIYNKHFQLLHHDYMVHLVLVLENWIISWSNYIN